jgi:AcrR family transcriptional regulator
MHQPSYKERERQRRQGQILAVAEQVLLQGGYANLNMDELANQVGISKPTLYQHFKSKDELVVTVILRSFSSMDEFVSRPLDEPAIERLIALIRRSLTIHSPLSVMGSLRGNIRPDAIWKTLQDHPELAERKQCFMQHLYTMVNLAKEEGTIDPTIPTQIVTHTLLALNRSLADPTLQAEIANNPEKLESAVDSVIRVFLHGVTPSHSKN